MYNECLFATHGMPVESSIGEATAHRLVDNGHHPHGFVNDVRAETSSKPIVGVLSRTYSVRQRLDRETTAGLDPPVKDG